MQMRSLVFFRKRFESTQQRFSFPGRILGVDHESEAIEFRLIPGLFAFRDHLAQPCGQIRNLFRGDHNEQSPAYAQFTID